MIVSRILSAADADVRPITWRSRPAALTHAESSPSSEELTRQLEAEIQQQARLAFESGVREGEAAARQKIESEVRQLTVQLAQSAADVASSRSEAIRRAEADVVRLAVEIAQRIIHRELSEDPAALGSIIRAALEKLASQEVHRVRVHPGQAETVRACLGQMDRGANIEVISDATQPPGGAVFETSRGSLDASLETQLQEIERGLAQQLQEHE
jgi:flagellar assembly protein FliH